MSQFYAFFKTATLGYTPMQINLSGISLKKGLLRHFIGQYKWVALVGQETGRFG
jgi:hypothetical protein